MIVKNGNNEAVYKIENATENQETKEDYLLGLKSFHNFMFE